MTRPPGGVLFFLTQKVEVVKIKSTDSILMKLTHIIDKLTTDILVYKTSF